MAGFTIVHMADFERPFPKWALARKALGLTSFEMNLCELAPRESTLEHDETARDQEDVFITLGGDATAADVTVLIVSAPRSSGYEPREWA